MDAIEALLNRTSWARLVEPVPNDEELQVIYQSALRAPDHGMLRPWRFLVIRGEALNKLGQLFVDAIQPEEEAKRDKLLNAPLRAPMIIVAVTCFKEHPKVPPVEQIGATAAAVQNMNLAAYAQGYASIWRTGEVAFNDGVKKGLGLNNEDEIVGYLYLGTPTVKERKVPENKVEDFFEEWTGASE